EVFLSYTPLVEGIALDEAFLDVAGARRLFGDAETIAHAIRDRIAEELRLPCAVGVGPTKLIAKLASKAAKPKPDVTGALTGKGVVVVRPGEELAFLHPLPVNALWGVGPATEERLRRFGVTTVGELAALPRQTLIGALGQANGAHLHDLAWGRDPRPVEPQRGVKSIGHEETYAVDLIDRDDIHREAVRMADAVAARLRKARVAGRTVTVKVRFHDFSTITRSHTFAGPVDTAPDIGRAAVALLEMVDSTPGIRLLGVSMSNLVEGAARQLTLDDVGSPAWNEASQAVDAVRQKFGDRALGPATLIDEDGLRIKRQGEQQWGPRGKRDR
ncbi:MAG TPA: DNA polymerase IV, partial [Acidimicrobiales bacterium]